MFKAPKVKYPAQTGDEGFIETEDTAWRSLAPAKLRLHPNDACAMHGDTLVFENGDGVPRPVHVMLKTVLDSANYDFKARKVRMETKPSGVSPVVEKDRRLHPRPLTKVSSYTQARMAVLARTWHVAMVPPGLSSPICWAARL